MIGIKEPVIAWLMTTMWPQVFIQWTATDETGVACDFVVIQ